MLDWSDRWADILAILALGGFVLWQLLFFWSRTNIRIAMGYPRFGVVVRNLIPDGTIEDALRAASDRRAKLQAFLNEYGPDRLVRAEFLEVPPGLENPRLREFATNEAAAAYTAHLRWQLQDDRYLLLERVVDALVCLRGETPRIEELSFTVGLMKSRI